MCPLTRARGLDSGSPGAGGEEANVPGGHGKPEQTTGTLRYPMRRSKNGERWWRTTSENWPERIRLGEDSALELKRVVLAGSRVEGPGRNDLADELAAFANTRGGTVVLGVDDKTREVLGIPLDDLDAVEGWVREICNDSIKPALDADIYKMELEGADGRVVPVIHVEIPRSLFVHRSPGGYFRRLGSSKRELAPEALARLFQERSQSRIIRFDESVVPGTTPGDLDYGLTRRFLREDRTEEGVTKTAARKLRVVADDDRGASRPDAGRCSALHP